MTGAETGAETVMRMTRVTRRFGPHVALLDVTAELSAGIYGLLGPNGAGKSTFLRLAAGLIKPTTGTVRWLGDHPRRHRALDNAIALCGDGEQLPSDETPLQLITLLLRCAGVSAGAASDHAGRELATFGLTEQQERPIRTLSRGQRQRVKLTQAFALPARLLLLDEPLNALDPVWRLRVSERMQQAAADGACVVMSSHILAEVEAVADRLLLLFRGRVVAAGTRVQIRDMIHHRGASLAIACDQPRQLGAELMKCGSARSMRVDADWLVIDTDDMPGLARALPGAVVAVAARISEVRTEGDDLVSLFADLAGEVR